MYAAFTYKFERLYLSISILYNFILLLHNNYEANIVFNTSVQQLFVTFQITVFHKLPVPAKSPGYNVSSQRFCKPQTRPRLTFVFNHILFTLYAHWSYFRHWRGWRWHYQGCRATVWVCFSSVETRWFLVLRFFYGDPNRLIFPGSQTVSICDCGDQDRYFNPVWIDLFWMRVPSCVRKLVLPLLSLIKLFKCSLRLAGGYIITKMKTGVFSDFL